MELGASETSTEEETSEKCLDEKSRGERKQSWKPSPWQEDLQHLLDLLDLLDVVTGGPSHFYCCSRLWNQLPADMCLISDPGHLKSKLKSYLFRRAFNTQQGGDTFCYLLK